MKKFLTILGLAAATMWSCTKPIEATLDVKTREVVIAPSGSIGTINFTTNVDWTAEASESWVGLGARSGSAGTVELKVVVDQDPNYQARTATVVIKAGDKTAEVKVSQDYVRVFDSTMDALFLDSSAQEVAIRVKSNMTYTVSCDADWISQTKAAPVDSQVNLSVTANTGIELREADVVLTAEDGEVVKVTIMQDPSENALVAESVVFLGNSMYPYDMDNSCPTDFQEVYFQFKSAKGTVAVALNMENLQENPAGEYVIDAAADHTPGTFSIKPTDVYNKYYTVMVEDGKEIAIADGLVTVAIGEGETCIMSIQLMDEKEKVYEFGYEGVLPSVSEDLSGAVAGASFGGDYNTHFAKQQKSYTISLYSAKGLFQDCPSLYSMYFTIWGDKSTTNRELPLGVFTFNPKYTEVESGYANGNYEYADNAMSSFSASFNYHYDEEWEYWTGDSMVVPEEGGEGTVEISKGSVDGTYTFKVKTVVMEDLGDWDEDWNWIPKWGEPVTIEQTFEDVYVSISDNHSEPVEDGDIEFTAPVTGSQYLGYWFGDSYANGANVFAVGFNSGLSGEYSANFVIQTAGEWEFTKNFNNRFCNTPIPVGEYKFVATKEETVDGDGNPVNCIANVKAARFKTIKNNYTGTVSYVSGGSITIGEDTFTFNVTAKTPDGSKEFHFTGSFASTLYYVQDYSAANRQSNVAWAE